MSREFSLEVDGLSKYQRWLAGMPGPKVDAMKSRVLRTVGLRFLEYAHDLTPVRTGWLRETLSADLNNPDTIFEVSVGRKSSHVRVGTAVPYAKHVNDGYTQKRGQFVPGRWKGNRFEYNPTLKGEGMVLTGKVIPGAHMFDKAFDYTKDEVPQILEFQFRRLYRELNG